MPIKRSFFSTTEISNERRISLSPALMRNLNLSAGDSLDVYVDNQTEEIVITRATEKPGRKKRTRAG